MDIILNSINTDLASFSRKDISLLYNYYNVNDNSSLAAKIYNNLILNKEASLPSGTIFDAVNNNRFEDFMEFLNDPNFDPNARDRNVTILMECVLKTKKNGEKYVKELLKKNPNLNLQNNDGWTALMFASRYSNDDSTENTVKMLVAGPPGGPGADLNLQTSSGITALMLASLYSKTTSSENTVKMLVTAGADLNLQNNDGWTALMFASRYSNDDSTENTVKMLVVGPPGGPGADLNLQTSSGNTALMLASLYSKTTSSENTVKMLVTAGADLNLQNKNGYTALMMASAYSNSNSSEDTVRILVAAGADLNLQDNDGQTAVQVADDIRIQLLLVENGAKITPDLKEVIKIKTEELRSELQKYKSELEKLELEILRCNEKEVGGLEEMENLKECIKNAKRMKKYRPGGEKMKKLEKKYKGHSYFL